MKQIVDEESALAVIRWVQLNAMEDITNAEHDLPEARAAGNEWYVQQVLDRGMFYHQECVYLEIAISKGAVDFSSSGWRHVVLSMCLYYRYREGFELTPAARLPLPTLLRYLPPDHELLVHRARETEVWP